MKTDALLVRVPGDKSLTHRALMLASLATGTSSIRRPLVGADTESTAAALRALGCPVPALDQHVRVTGLGLRGLKPPAASIDCGNSGTTTRLLMGILAGHDLAATLTGDASLRSRPMRRVTVPLSHMGARFEELEAADRLPIRVHGGRLRGTTYDSPHASAQVKSAILLAALCGGVRATVTEPILSRDHTERMLGRLGVSLQRDALPDGRARVSIDATERIESLDVEIPADFSSAAFAIAAACVGADRPVCIPGVGLNPTRTGLMNVLARMGASVHIDNARESCGEPLGDVVAERSSLVGTRITAAEVPSLIDEIPVIAALAARAEGTTTIEGAGELRFKESDRIAAVVANLRAVGVDAEERADGLVVHGGDHPLQGPVKVMHDHRIAMAFGVLAAAGEPDRITIADRDVVAISYPEFWTMLDTVRGVK